MKVMCIYNDFWYDNSPRYGDICTVTKMYYDPTMPDGINAYNFEEHPVPEPYRFGAWRRVKPGSNILEPNFIEMQENEDEEAESISEQIELLY